jgi:hypothetical protein
MSVLLLVLDLVGTFVFAISAASAAATRRLDLFGTLVLSFGEAVAGVHVTDVGPRAARWWASPARGGPASRADALIADAPPGSGARVSGQPSAAARTLAAG